jgi:hypothetical protein
LAAMAATVALVMALPCKKRKKQPRLPLTFT